MSHDGPFALDSLSSKHVLLVDDNGDGLSPLGAILRHCGALVIAASSDAHALRLLDQVKPDAIVIVIPHRLRPPLPLVVRIRAASPNMAAWCPSSWWPMRTTPSTTTA